jgi:xylulokinase
VASAFYPEKEAPIMAVKAGWAEQDPESWWNYAKLSLKKIMSEAGATAEEVKAIGISYQMHGLVCVDKDLKPLRPSIIWCDSRAVPYGERAFRDLGADQCLSHLLNSPGNFTAAKLAWVKENEPDLYNKIYKVLLPGDYLALRLSGVANTTVSGLSEGMFWDFKEKQPANFLLDYFGFDHSLIADIVPTFAVQSEVCAEAAAELGLKAGTPITYRGGDQPNNALSLNVLNPGEIAATAGTSGVVYGVLGDVNYDPKSRVNTFAHVNHTADQTRLGVLLCINGTGILNAWVHRNITPDISYAEMNDLAAQAPIGSEGVTIIPFGNGAEKTLAFVTNQLLPKLLERGIDTEHCLLGGYSLAGLFALWASYQSDRFEGIAAASPSVWFPGWIAYATEYKPQADFVYLSLGDKEEKARNPLMAQVGNAIRKQKEILKEQGMNTILEWNAGNHFVDSEKRMAKGFAWLMNNMMK